MTSPAVTTVQQQQQQLQCREVQLTCTELPLHIPHTRGPLFTAVDAPPLSLEAATLLTSPLVHVHRGKDLAMQQRSPVGAQTVGAVEVRTHSLDKSSTSTGGSHTLPIYQARVAFRRPNAYKERPSWCIVDDSSSPNPNVSSAAAKGHRGRHRPGRSHEARDNGQQVCFVDLVSLTFASRALLRCVRTGELLVPTPLYCRYNISSAAADGATGPNAAAPAGAAVKVAQGQGEAGTNAPGRNGRNKQREEQHYGQHHRRRVVMLPASASGETYELIVTVTKRAREEMRADDDERHPSVVA